MSRAQQLIRFGIVGCINTLVDIGLFVVLRKIGLPVVPANTVSTSVALGVSYLLNFRYTFRSNHSRTRLVLFLLVTCSGLWILHPIVITLVTKLNDALPLLSFIESATGNHALAWSVAPKLAATAVTLLWNFAWYSQKIFTGSESISDNTDH